MYMFLMIGLSQRVRKTLTGAILCLVAGAVPSALWGQNITVSGPGFSPKSLTGPNYQIDANLGQQRGGNLFHSFGVFGLNKSETATFTPVGSSQQVNNVIGRVVGGSQSSIDGAIKSTISGANLFLINPSGIVFGPNAT